MSHELLDLFWVELEQQINVLYPFQYEFIVSERQLLMTPEISKFTLVINEQGQIFGSEGPFDVRQELILKFNNQDMRLKCTTVVLELLQPFIERAKVSCRQHLLGPFDVAPQRFRSRHTRSLIRQLLANLSEAEGVIEQAVNNSALELYLNVSGDLPPPVLLRCVYRM